MNINDVRPLASKTQYEFPDARDYWKTDENGDVVFPTITICSSMKYADIVPYVTGALINAGWITYGLASAVSPKDVAVYRKPMYVAMWNQMIKSSDAIFVINMNTDIGESVKCEIATAKEAGIPVFYMIGGTKNGF